MTAGCGAAIIISAKDGSGSYQAVGGLRNKRITLNAESVDVTNSDSTGRWKELLDGCGVRSASFAGDGVFLDDAGLAACIDAMMNNNNRSLKCFIPGLGTFEGMFKFTQLEFSGAYSGEDAYSVTLDSAGVLAYTSN